MRQRRYRDHRIDGGLHPLPDGLPLEELVVDNLPTKRNLQGVDRWPTLERVTVNGVPRADEIAALAALPALHDLTIRRPDAIADLPGLAALGTLRGIAVDDVPPVELDAVHEALGALDGVDIWINGRPHHPRHAA